MAGGHEERTRVVCHLPLNNPEEHQAVDAVFTYLESFRTKHLGVKGYTHSAIRPPAHFGNWWSNSRRKWIRGKVVLCIVDYRVNFNDQEMTQILTDLKKAIKEAYEQLTGIKQEEVWVVAHHLVR